MRLRVAAASIALVASGLVGATFASAPAQALVVAPSKACYPVCTPALATSRKVVAPGYKMTFKATNFKGKTAVNLESSFDQASGTTSSSGAASLKIYAPADPGKYRVSAKASGQTASTTIYVPGFSAPVGCQVGRECTFTASPIEPGTTVKFAASGSSSNCETSQGGESVTCTVTFAPIRKNKLVSWKLTTGVVYGKGKVAVVR